jgi:hypothetical protein
VNENGDLQNGIRVQMGQVNVVEIKEAAEKGRDGKAEAAEKKRSVDYRLVGILCRPPWERLLNFFALYFGGISSSSP